LCSVNNQEQASADPIKPTDRCLPAAVVSALTGYNHGCGCTLDGHGLEDQQLCGEMHQGDQK
jgi:hypothetical protein